MEEANEDYSRQEITNKYDVIKNAIPQDWIKRIENMEEGKQKKDMYVKMGEKLYAFNECTVKIFYCIFRNAVFKKPVVNEYWLRKYSDLNEDSIWGNMNGKLVQTKLENSEYFIRHKVIFTDVILNKIGMESSATCKVCNYDDEGFLHLFLYCKELEDFNGKCKSMILGLRGEDNEYIEWNKVVMLGLIKQGKNKKLIHLLVMLIKSAIWERRVVAKREKVLMNVWHVFKRKFERYVQCLLYYFKQEEKMCVFYNVFTEDVCKVLKESGLEMSLLHNLK